MSTKDELLPSSHHDAKLPVIRWLGECIFPQPINASAEKFGEHAIIACINEGLIVRSQSNIGPDPTMMCKPRGYMELSDAGWELYKKLTGEAMR